jgi:hypothetical protein
MLAHPTELEKLHNCVAPPQASGFPVNLNFFVNSVKDQSIKRSIGASRKIQERSRALVCESAMLIATGISLTDEMRLASARRKAQKKI